MYSCQASSEANLDLTLDWRGRDVAEEELLEELPDLDLDLPDLEDMEHLLEQLLHWKLIMSLPVMRRSSTLNVKENNCQTQYLLLFISEIKKIKSTNYLTISEWMLWEMTLVKMISLKLSARAHLQQLPMWAPCFSPDGRNIDNDDDDDDEAESMKCSKNQFWLFSLTGNGDGVWLHVVIVKRLKCQRFMMIFLDNQPINLISRTSAYPTERAWLKCIFVCMDQSAESTYLWKINQLV